MRVPRSELSIKDITEAKRVKVGRARDRREEILVRFVDVETRDRIATYARNLGDYVENGKPTATFRHDIPVHLSEHHRTLMQYGHALRNRYGKELRRNVRFDDVGKKFCIDILIPGNDKWETVSYERALQDCKQQANEIERKRGDAFSSKPAAAISLQSGLPVQHDSASGSTSSFTSADGSAMTDGVFLPRSSTSHPGKGVTGTVHLVLPAHLLLRLPRLLQTWTGDGINRTGETAAELMTLIRQAKERMKLKESFLTG